MVQIRSHHNVVRCIIFFFLLLGYITQIRAEPISCNSLHAGDPIPSPWGAAYNVLSPQKEFLISAICDSAETAITVGNGNETGDPGTFNGFTYAYHLGFFHDGIQWNEFQLSCAGSDTIKVAGVWCKGKARANLPNSVQSFVGYTCTWFSPSPITGQSQWHCGCTNAQCASSNWQLQEVNRHVKLIYLGVYGASGPFQAPDWIDPRDHYQVSPLDNSILNSIAFNDSVLSAIGLKIAASFPTSVTLVIGFDQLTLIGESDIVSDLVKSFYSKGDKVYLAGHSSGGSTIQESAKQLKQLGIPVQMTAQIDSIGVDALIPSNVKRAFNFYHPIDFLCPLVGEDNIYPESSAATLVSNQGISNPTGPDSGFCAAHKNMDNDLRVWPPIVNYILQSAKTD